MVGWLRPNRWHSAPTRIANADRSATQTSQSKFGCREGSLRWKHNPNVWQAATAGVPAGDECCMGTCGLYNSVPPSRVLHQSVYHSFTMLCPLARSARTMVIGQVKLPCSTVRSLAEDFMEQNRAPWNLTTAAPPRFNFDVLADALVRANCNQATPTDPDGQTTLIGGLGPKARHTPPLTGSQHSC